MDLKGNNTVKQVLNSELKDTNMDKLEPNNKVKQVPNSEQNVITMEVLSFKEHQADFKEALAQA